MRYVREEMTQKKWIPFVVVLVALALVAAGCGDDDDSDGGATEVSVATTETGNGDATTETAAGGSLAEQCVASTEAGYPGLSDEAHRKIEEACQTGASGDTAAALEAGAEACRIITEETVPKGPARDQALAACGVAPGAASP